MHIRTRLCNVLFFLLRHAFFVVLFFVELALLQLVFASDYNNPESDFSAYSSWQIQQSTQGEFVLCQIGKCIDRSIKHLYVIAPPIQEVITTPIDSEAIKPELKVKKLNKKKYKKRHAVKCYCKSARVKRG